MAKQSPKTVKTSGNVPVIAIIGCGAIAESFHLPALARHPTVRKNLILVDRNLERAQALATRYGVGAYCRDYQEILKTIDGAVIAVPHALHYSIALDCVRNGVHVLCEKPLAESMAQLNEIVTEAERTAVAVSVNNNRRLFPSFRKVQQLIASRDIGSIRHLEICHGEKFDWPSATASYFGAHSSGKGVLLDTGAHIVDLVCWWLGGKPGVICYEDDSLGGSEAVAKLSFKYGDCTGRIHLSWLSKLQNSFRIRGEWGSIEGNTYDWRTITVGSRSGKRTKIRARTEFRDLSDLGRMLIDNFLDIISKGVHPLVSPRDVMDSVALIEECYACRGRFAMPWHDVLHRIA